jgi:hypothetical protein
MVAVAQLVEPWIVIPVVVGSSPISHPNPFYLNTSIGQFSSTLCGTISVVPDDHRQQYFNLLSIAS